ncbi:MAG: BON domain-containing protein [Caldimonas sp.]
MTPSLRRSILAGSLAAVAAAGLLAGCEKSTTQNTDGTKTTTTTVTVPALPASVPESMRAAASEVATGASQAMTKAGEMIEDGAITAKVKTALLADPDVKGLMIDVDTKDGVVTLKGSADKAGNRDRAVSLAKGTGGVKSVDDQLVVK